jgi:hypothetical protein
MTAPVELEKSTWFGGSLEKNGPSTSSADPEKIIPIKNHA